MKKLWISILLVLSLGTICLAATKVEAPDSCKQCGMNRTMFAQSRMIVTYTDGSSAGTCSLNCVVTDLKAARGKKVKSFQVADYNSKKLINAKTATWVIGGSKPGVMTRVAKWAFADKLAAEAFIKLYGGKKASFKEALKASEDEQAENAATQKQPVHKGHGEHKM
ncbi:MAG: nitrous oxide reductase accessory protein NosL [Geobacteraceae bacterium]|nr:nitrous oxide reductase accessory protein NosL [Geobacteraceae bacterium]